MTPTIALPQVYRQAVTSFAAGKSAEAVLDDLIKKGLPESYARNLMTAAFRETVQGTSDSKE
jgi:hypothetical protein